MALETLQEEVHALRAELTEEFGKVNERLASIEGQFAVISPRDIVELKTQVASVKTQATAQSGLFSAIVAGLVAMFFRN